jgi:alkanesulfonate monooxygenase SsuD/methylene tetrahydromethanopterin reductase-like flavin-dependent oxidoreductase (luciferase family)
MRFGIIILPDRPWREAAPLWRRAEEYGFHHVWTYDHLGWRDLVNGPWFDSMATLTAAAHVTERVKLGTMVASPNFRHPAHFAREVTTADDVSGGRLLLGVGSGGIAGFDTEVLGQAPLTPRQRVDRYGEFVEVLHRLLREGRVTHRGEYYTAIDARCEVSRIPLVLAANGPRSMRIATRYGQGWVTTGEKTGDLEQWWASVEKASRLNSDSAERFLSLDAAPVFSLSSVEYFREAVARASELGFTDVLTHWPRESSWYAGKESVLEAVAATLGTWTPVATSK